MVKLFVPSMLAYIYIFLRSDKMKINITIQENTNVSTNKCRGANKMVGNKIRVCKVTCKEVNGAHDVVIKISRGGEEQGTIKMMVRMRYK